VDEHLQLVGRDLDEVDAVHAAVGAHDLPSAHVAARVSRRRGDVHGVLRSKVAVVVWPRREYWTVTRRVESSASTSIWRTSIRSPSHCTSAPCTAARVAVASGSLLGRNTYCSSPVPNDGRLTRSPGEVKSTCSIRSRTWSSSPVVAVWPRPSRCSG